MGLDIIELPFSETGKSYELDDKGKNYIILETKVEGLFEDVMED